MKYSNQDLLDEIRRLAVKLGHPPSLKEMRFQGKHPVTTYYDRFGSWRESLREAGFEPREPDTEIPEDDHLMEIERLESEIGETPSARQMDEHGDIGLLRIGTNRLMGGQHSRKPDSSHRTRQKSREPN